MAAEASAPEKRGQLLQDARKACATATDHAKRVRDYGAAESIRLRGVLAWLEGRNREAEALWHEAVGVAQRLGAKPVLAKTHLDIGTRLGRVENLTRAQQLFDEIGATTAVIAAKSRSDRSGLVSGTA